MSNPNFFYFGLSGAPNVIAEISIEEAIRSLALGSTCLASMISDRWMPHFATAKQPRPFVAYHRFAIEHQYGMSGATGMTMGRLQLDLLSDTYAMGKAMAGAIRQRLNGFRGTVTTVDGQLWIQRIQILDQREEYVAPIDASDVGIYRNIIDLSFSCSESIPTGT